MNHPRLLYLNPLFDLELGNYPVDKIRQSAIEMGPLFAFCGNRNDRILLDVNVPDDYWHYLDSLSIPYAPVLAQADTPSDFKGMAWGWNESSALRFRSLGVPINHPDLSVVKKINNRKFCAEFNQASSTGVPGSRFCSSPQEVRHAIHDLNSFFPLVAKPAFGGSGMGFVTIDDPEKDLPAVDAIAAHNGCTIEPWCERIHDVSSSCVINEDGTITDLRHYCCYTNSRGMFYGVIFGAKDSVAEKHQRDLAISARAACTSLSNEKYFGPVSFDSIVYHEKESGSERLATVIEINGRCFMSAIAHALFEKIGTDRTCFFRFLGKKQCVLPDSYVTLKSKLGNGAYDPATRRGIMLLSALRVYHEKNVVQPVRSAFLIAGSSQDEIRSMDDQLRGLFTT